MRDDVKPDDIPGEDVIQLKSSIRSSLAEAGIDAFTYIYLVTALEYAHEVDEV